MADNLPVPRPHDLPSGLAPRAETHEPYAPQEPAALDIHRWRMAVSRYKWWIVGLTVLGTLAGIALTRVVPPRYFVQATIWIKAEPSGNAERGPIGADQLMPAQASVDLLKSYVVLDEVARQRRLYLRARARDRALFDSLTVREQFQPGEYRLHVDQAGTTYRLDAENGVTLEQGTVGDSVGKELGIVWAPTAAVLAPGTDVKFALTPVRDAAKGLADALKVGIDPSGQFLRIAAVAPNGQSAAVTVNAVAQRFVAVAAELKRGKLTELARLLDDQLASARENLRRAENALTAYRARTITLGPAPNPAPPTGAGLSPNVDPRRGGDFFSLRLEADELRRDRQAIERGLARIASDSGETIEALAYIGAVQRSADLTAALKEATTKRAELRAMLYRYTSEHPTVRRLADDVTQLERRTIPALARTVIAQLDARLNALAPEIAAGGRELQEVPQRAVEEARLKRDADIAAGLYSIVLQRQAEARLAEASAIPDVRILDAAIAPRNPVKDTGRRLIALGLLFGLALGIAGAVIVDRLDPRVRYREQITRDMGLRILGMLPHVRIRDGGSNGGPKHDQQRQLVEAMRSVRLSLSHAYGPERPMVLTVTSPGMGDGKSFLSSNLAKTCAYAGLRTIVIDGDTRRGTLHNRLQMQRKPGLTDLLAGRATLEQVLQSTSVPRLDFIGAGSRLTESPELLGSAAMEELIRTMRSRYQVILIDSPPLGAGIDPYTLGTLAGSVLIVIRTGATNMTLARTALEMLDHLPIRLLGAVLNDVRPQQMYGYYGYYYLAGYGTADEGNETAAGSLQTSHAIAAGRPQNDEVATTPP